MVGKGEGTNITGYPASLGVLHHQVLHLHRHERLPDRSEENLAMLLQTTNFTKQTETSTTKVHANLWGRFMDSNLNLYQEGCLEIPQTS